MTSPRLSRALFAGLAALTLVGGVLVASGASAEEKITTIDVSPSQGPRGGAFTPDGELLFMTAENSDEVVVIDALANAVVTRIPVGNAPAAVAVSPDGSLAYAVASGSGSTGHAVYVIDVATLAVVGSPIDVGFFPYDVEFSKDGETAYVAGLGTGSVIVIDVATATVTHTVTGGSETQSIALSPDGATLWVLQAGQNKVQPFDTATNTLGVGFTISDPSNPGLHLRTMALSSDGTQVALGGDGSTLLYLANLASQTVVDTVETGSQPYYPAYTPDGSRIYVGLNAGGASVIDAGTGNLIETIPLTGRTNGMTISPTNFAYASNYDSATVTVLGDPPLVSRLAGNSRYATAIKISQAGFPTGANVVFVATGLDYPDALAAGPAAAEMGGPVILSDPTTLLPEVKAEIERLAPTHIYVVGGTGRISDAIKTQLTTIAPTDRISGASRFETSRLIADLAFGTVSDVYVATGLNFPDALAAGAAGAVFGAPVLLVDGAASTVDQATLNLLTSLGAPDVTVVGGTNWVSAGIETQLDADRIAGTSRYETALQINQAAYAGDTATRAIIATGVIFPDALSASAWAGRIDAPLYLSPGTCVPQGVLDHMTSLGVLQVTLVGGADRLTQSVFDLVPCA